MASIPFALASMALTAFLQWLSIFAFGSLGLSFFLYSLLGCAVLPLLDLLLLRKTGLRGALAALGLGGFGRRPVIIGLAVGLTFAALIWIAFGIGGRLFLSGSRAAEAVRAWGIPRGPLAIFPILGLLANGALEEIYWRGYLQYRLAGLKSPAVRILLPAAVFGAQHWFVMSALVKEPFSLALMMLGISCAGVFWGVLLERLKGLAASLLSHVIVAAGYLGILYVFVLL